MAYDRVEPFGEERGDLRAGIVAATVANANRGKNSKPYAPGDFMPKFAEKTEGIVRQTPEEMKALLMTMVQK
jgi:hypothetical protein